MNNDSQSSMNTQFYLWAVGLDTEAFPPGKVLSDRYRVIDAQIVLDMQTFKLPEIPEDLPSYVISYLKLSRFPLHFPRPYGLLRWGEELELTEILLLENVPIDSNSNLLPKLEDSWAGTSALRQINWLWQILQLWQPLQEQNMTLTLLQPQFLRVDGPWVRIVELQADVTQVELAQLGDLWLPWLPNAQPEIAEQIAKFFYDLAANRLDVNAAIAYLDNLAAEVFQAKPITIRIASATDKGPRRDHNEDTCYPDPKRPKRLQQAEILRDRLAIICDGLGGHEGGEVASSMAIKTLEQQLQVLLRQVETDTDPFSPQTFMAQLEASIRVVNDLIVARNDQQQRQAQQRMGTTLVMALSPRPQGKPSHEIYIVHVGDSRIYWITPDNCNQITLDDDVATRETILGYNFAAYSSQRLDGGALIQALGTRGSDALVPRVQRFSFDEDCLLLLCSDGLSDYDRVDELWQQYLRPVLVDNLPLATACQTLIEKANTLNGHDNSTVVLMRCRLSETDLTEDLEEETTKPAEDELDENSVERIADEIEAQAGGELVPTVPAFKAESDLDSAPQQTSRGFVIALVVAMFLLGSAIAAFQVPTFKTWIEKNLPIFPRQAK